jgi:hypothetical protein
MKFADALKPLWQKWLREAAAERGITVKELQRKLDRGELLLEITATTEPTWPNDQPSDQAKK